MKFVSLVSGGKDSIFNTLQAISYGHELVCIANLYPASNKEEDSFMYQTVGVELAPLQAKCLEVPIVRREIKGTSKNQNLYYEKGGEEDEVEDLFMLLEEVKKTFPEVQAVASGAIFSDYQRLRVENCCQRLGYISLAYLWLKDQEQLLQEMIDHKIDAQIVKICSMGLKPLHLGKNIAQLQPHLMSLKSKFDMNVCGEGGEFESAVFNCPIFKNFKIVSKKQEVINHTENDVAPVAYLRYEELDVEEKTEQDKLEDSQIMNALIESRKVIPEDHLYSEDHIQAQTLEKYESVDQTDLYEKITLSASIIDPKLSKDDIGNMSQKDQLLFIMEYLKQLSLNKQIVKVYLLVTDLAEFKPLNAEYVKYFGIKPPVRVCIAIPGNEIIMSFLIWKDASSIDDVRDNLHVQSVSQWAPPNIGPYSQINKMDNLIFMAGMIALYPPTLSLINTEDVILQYQQVKWNFNKVLRRSLKTTSEDFSWKQVAISAVIYVSESAKVEYLLLLLQKDFSQILDTSVIVRIPKLPVNCLIEIELICDEGMGVGNKTKCMQNFHVDASTLSGVANHVGDIYYNCNSVTKDQIRQKMHKTEQRQIAYENVSIIPALEIIPLNKVGETQPNICERFYQY